MTSTPAPLPGGWAVPAPAANPSAHNNTANDGSITIVLLQDVPAAVRDKLVRIH